MFRQLLAANNAANANRKGNVLVTGKDVSITRFSVVSKSPSCRSGMKLWSMVEIWSAVGKDGLGSSAIGPRKFDGWVLPMVSRRNPEDMAVRGVDVAVREGVPGK